MEIATHKDHLVSVEQREDGVIKMSLKDSNPAAVTIKNGERLSIFFQVGPTLASGKKTCCIDVEMKEDKLIVVVSRLDDVTLVNR